MTIKVFIDQDLCTGDGICAELCPKIFAMHSDGLAYVKEADWPDMFGPAGSGGSEPALQGARGAASVPLELLDDVIDSAEECPGECIYLFEG